MQSLAAIPEFEADPHEQTQRKQHYKCEKKKKKKLLPKTKQKNHGKMK